MRRPARLSAAALLVDLSVAAAGVALALAASGLSNAATCALAIGLVCLAVSIILFFRRER